MFTLTHACRNEVHSCQGLSIVLDNPRAKHLLIITLGRLREQVQMCPRGRLPDLTLYYFRQMLLLHSLSFGVTFFCVAEAAVSNPEIPKSKCSCVPRLLARIVTCVFLRGSGSWKSDAAKCDFLVECGLQVHDLRYEGWMKKFLEFQSPREHVLHHALLRGVRGGFGDCLLMCARKGYCPRVVAIQY